MSASYTSTSLLSSIRHCHLLWQSTRWPRKAQKSNQLTSHEKCCPGERVLRVSNYACNLPRLVYNTPSFLATTKLLGTAAAIQRQMEEVKAYRKDITHRNWRRVKIKILAVVRFGGSLRRTEKAQENIGGKIEGTSFVFLKMAALRLALISMQMAQSVCLCCTMTRIAHLYHAP